MSVRRALRRRLPWKLRMLLVALPGLRWFAGRAARRGLRRIVR